MCKEHIKALKEITKGEKELPVLKYIASTGTELIATDLDIAVKIKMKVKQGLYEPEALELGFRDELICKDYTLEDFPELPFDKQARQELELSSEDIEKIIRAGEFASKDLTRPILTGVALQSDKVYGTDGYRLYRNKIDNEVTDAVVIPSAFVKLLKTIKADKHNWVLSVYDGYVVFSSGNIELYSKTIGGVIPQFETVICTGNTYATEFVLHLKDMVVPKGYKIRVDKTDKTICIIDDSYKQVDISTEVNTTGGNLEESSEVNIVMAMNCYEGRYIMLDPTLLKPYRKHTIKCYAHEDNGQIRIEIIK